MFAGVLAKAPKRGRSLGITSEQSERWSVRAAEAFRECVRRSRAQRRSVSASGEK
jgi:hypothetical protein